MAEVLVLVDHVDGTVRKTTLEMLTIARRLGEPSAVFIGAGLDASKEVLAQYGAEKIYRFESADYDDYVVAPKAEVLAQLVASASPAAVLMTSSPEGKEIAGRLSIKTESGLITDMIDVPKPVRWHQSAPLSPYSPGGFTVQATVTKQTPIITVRRPDSSLHRRLVRCRRQGRSSSPDLRGTPKGARIHGPQAEGRQRATRAD